MLVTQFGVELYRRDTGVFGGFSVNRGFSQQRRDSAACSACAGSPDASRWNLFGQVRLF